MSLHLTKVAFGISSLAELGDRARARAEAGQGWVLTTRYLPKRVGEVAGGSLFWIVKHTLIARTPIIGFTEAEGGRHAIELATELVLVNPRAKRAHQGWRYLEGADAPADLGGNADGLADMPPALVGRLSALALI